MTAKKAQLKSSLVDPVTEYAKKAVSGDLVVGEKVRNACKRHLQDIKNGGSRGLVWDLDSALRVIRFFENVLKLSGGDYQGRPFTLLSWQKFVVGSLFGWKCVDGTRRFNISYVETGKGSGKSPLSAGIGLYGLTADGEYAAEIYAAATKKDQAMVLFRDAVSMVNQSPELSRRITKSGTGLNVWNLAFLQTGSFFKPISSDENSQSGPRPYFGLIDEYHEHKTNAMVELIRAGFKNRRNPLLSIITNSGANKSSPCGEYHEYGAKVCAGDIDNDEFFAFICSLDDGDDPFKDESCWPKVNPSLQESNLPGVEYLRSQVKEARGMPSKEALVRRLNFCQWVEADSPWLSRDVWVDAVEDFEIEDLAGRRAWGGLDLSSTTDLTAFVLLVEPTSENDHWRLIPFGWLPEEGLAEKSKTDHVPYDVFVRQGHLLTTPGRANKKTHALHKIIEMSEIFDIQGIAYDRWRIEDLKALISDEGVTTPPLLPFGQGFKEMSPAIEAFETMLLNRRLLHNNNPVLNMCAANSVIEQDPAGNRKLNKKKATGRIDMMVAAIMAVGIKTQAQNVAKISDEDLMFAIKNPIIV